jgi:hypothetical protein
LEYEQNDDTYETDNIINSLKFMANHWIELISQHGQFKIENNSIKFLDSDDCGCCPDCQEEDKL